MIHVSVYFKQYTYILQYKDEKQAHYMWPTAKLSTQQYRLVQKAHHAKPLLRCTIKFKEMNQQPIKSMYIILQSIIAGQNLSHLINS